MDNINKATETIQEILKITETKISYELSFPAYKILPDEVKLALSVLERNGMKIEFILANK